MCCAHLTGSLSFESLRLEKDSDRLALRLHAVRTGMDDANYLKTVDKVNLHICRFERSNNSEPTVPSVLFGPSHNSLESLL
jgi:hypothetical protein